MAQSNFQDVVVLNQDTLSMLGERIQVGSSAGSKSIVFAQDPDAASAIHLAAANATGAETIVIPDANGTLGLITAVSAGTTLFSNGQLVFSNSNNVSFGMNGGTITASILTGTGFGGLAAGTQTATSGTVIFSNSNGFSFGMNGSLTVTASADYVRSISAGTTNATGNQIVFSNSNGVSFGINGGTITATVTPGAAAGIAALSAGTTQFTSGTGVFSNSNGLQFGVNGNTVTAQLLPRSYFAGPNAPIGANAMATNSAGINLSIQRINLAAPLTATRLDMLGHLTVVGSTAGSLTLSIAAYTFAGLTASTVSSSSVAYTFNSGTTATTNQYGGFSGTRWRSVPTGTWNMSPGDYLIAIMGSVAGVAGTTGSMTLYGASSISINAETGTGGGYNPYFADGIYATATGGFPTSIHITAINQTGASAQRQPYFRLIGTGP